MSGVSPPSICCDDAETRRRPFGFDLLELDGTDLRREPIEVRKATLASILRKAATASVSTSTWSTTVA